MTSPQKAGGTVGFAPTDNIVDAIKGHLGNDVSVEQINAVISAWNQVREGDDIHTVRRDPTTGKVYVRVDDGGVHKWRVVDPANGGVNEFDLTPSLTFEALYTPPPIQAVDAVPVVIEPVIP